MTDATDTTAVDSASPVNSSVYGTVIPVMFGSAQVLGAPMWAAPVIQNDDGSRIVTAAYILGERDPQTTSVTLIKVWVNSLLAYSSDGNGGGASATGDSTFTFAFYDGSADQLADPTIVEQEGADVTPAFRGRMYIVIQNLQVTAGAEFPEITCEVTQHADFNNIRYATPFSLVNGPMQGSGPFFVDLPLGKMFAVQYGSTPQVIRTFDVNIQIDEINEYQELPLVFAPICTGRYSAFFFGIMSGRVAVQDWFGNSSLADVIAPYSGGLNCMQSSDYLADGSQVVIATGLGPAIQAYRFRQPLDIKLMRSINYDNSFNPNCKPAVFTPKATSPNNDYVMAYVAADRQILMMLEPGSGDTVTVGNRTIKYTAQDGFPGGRTIKDSLQSGHAFGVVSSLDVFLRDTMGEVHWAQFVISHMVIDPVAAAWLSVLVSNGNTGTTYWLKFYTPFNYLGLVTPGHTADGAGNPVPNPIPALPAVTDLTFVTSQKYATFTSPSVGGSVVAACSFPAKGQTKVGFVLSNSLCVLDMNNGSYNHYVHGTFVNTRTGESYGGDPNYDDGLIWNDTIKGFYYRNEAVLPNPGIVKLYANPTNKNALPLPQYLKSLALLGGFTDDQIVTTGFDNDGVVGSIINQSTAFLDLITTVCQLFNIDVIETGGQIKYSRRARGSNFAVDRTLTQAMLAPVDQSNADDGTLITKVRDATKTVPSVIQTSYLDSDNDFQIGTQSARRTIFPVRTIFTPDNTQTIGVPLAMTAVRALYLTELCLFDQWAQALTLTLRVSQANMDLEPGDYIAVNTDDFGDYIIKITEVDLNSDFSSTIIGYTVLAIPPDNLNLNNINVASKDPGLVAGSAENGNFNFYVCDNFNPTSAIGGETEANVYVYCDTLLTGYLKKTDGTYWKGIVLQGAITGVALTALGKCPTWALSRPDDSLTLKVRMNGGVPVAPTSDDAWRAGAGAVAVGTPGRWEVIYFRTVTGNSDGTYTLGGLIRGQRGTDTTGSPLGIGEGVVFISQSSPAPIGYNEFSGRATQAIAAYSNKSPTNGTSKIQTVLLNGGSVKPWAPVQVQATVDSSNNIQLTWNRRDRSDDLYAFGDEPDAPKLSEQLERYDVEINDTDGSVKRTYAGLTTPYCTYGHADVMSDGLDMTHGLNVTVYQISQLVGRGYGRKQLCLAN